MTTTRGAHPRKHAGPALLLALLAILLPAVTGCGLVTAPAGGSPPAPGAMPAADPAGAQPARPAAADQMSSDFGALGGYGCPQTDHVRFTEAGWYTDGISGFFGVRAGGWPKQGCDGRFGAMPMSGSATQPDPPNYALWIFRTAPVVTGTCQVAVYVPGDHSIVHVGGDPARYQVYDNAAASGPPAKSFTIDELTSLGTWVSVGSYPVTTGVLTVKLTSAGQDWHGNVETHAHLPVSQVIAFCGPRVPAPGPRPSDHRAAG
jgi:translation initiation factor IF-2